jgi:hypothetical protein
MIRRLEHDVFPIIGRRPIAEITPPELLAVIFDELRAGLWIQLTVPFAGAVKYSDTASQPAVASAIYRAT